MRTTAVLIVFSLLPAGAWAAGEVRPRAALPSSEAVLGQAQASEAAALRGLDASAEGAAEGGRNGFAERSGAAPVRVGGNFYAAAPAQTTAPRRFAASASPPPAVYAEEGGEKKAEGDKGPGWDYDKTVKAAGFALAGAAIGFLLGGPIGAAAGFLAGFFIGALIAKATEGGGC